MVNGVQQKPLEGVSMAYSFNDVRAAERHETQYFEMFGNRGIYHKGLDRGDEAPHAMANGSRRQSSRFR
jgi:arylsulfatase A-like enzyme